MPGGLFTGAKLNEAPVHTVSDCVVITGVGLTDTVTLKLLPVHPESVAGVTVYVAV